MRTRYGLALAAGLLAVTTQASAMGEASHSSRSGAAEHMMKKANASAAKSIVGKVDRIKGDTVVLKGNDNREHDLMLGTATRITKDGKKASRSDLHPGDEVRAAFERSGNELHASRITIESKNASAQHPSSEHRSMHTTEHQGHK